MEVIVLGCGRLGADLAYRLSLRDDVQVVVVDNDPAAFNNLPYDYSGRLVEGDVLSQDVLQRAGIEGADAVAVVTDSDIINAVVGHVARAMYQVPHVVVRNFDPMCRSLIEEFGLQVVSATHWGAQRIEEMLHHADIRSVFSAGNGEVEVYEFVVPVPWEGHTLGELVNDFECLATSLTRAGRASLPSLNTELATGDIIHVSATMKGIEQLREVLHAHQEG